MINQDTSSCPPPPPGLVTAACNVIHPDPDTGDAVWQDIHLNPSVIGNDANLETTVDSESCHAFGLDDCPLCEGENDSILFQPAPLDGVIYAPTDQDTQAVAQYNTYVD